MAKKYVSRCRVTLNGKTLLGMKNFKMGAVPYRAQVATSSGQGTVDIQKKTGFTLDYAIPKVDARLDWSTVLDATVVVELEGGKRVIYTGVDSLERGEMSVDFEKEVVSTISFAADSETIQ